MVNQLRFTLGTFPWIVGLSLPAHLPTSSPIDTEASRQGRTGRISYWQPDGVQRYLAASAQNYVGLMNDGQTVLKYPLCKTTETIQALREEAERYARVGPHENLVTFKGFSADGLLLEYCARGGLHDVIGGPSELTDEHKRTIGKQIVRCIVHLHEHHFIHCDLHVRNVFLTSDMVAKVGDLQGQLYRPDDCEIEMETMSQEHAKARHPHAGDDEFSPRTDLFALGTLLYHLWHGHEPFPDLDEFKHKELIEERYRKGQYPIDPRQSAGIDHIISKCWTSKYECAGQVLDDMERFDEQEWTQWMLMKTSLRAWCSRLAMAMWSMPS